MNDVKLDPREEKEFDVLRRMGQKLHVPIPEAKWKLEVFLGGKLIQSYEARSHSWVRNAYNHLFSELAGKNADDAVFGAGKLNIKTTAGVTENGERPIALYYAKDADAANGFSYRAAAGDNTHGIVVGSGTDAESFESYIMQTLIDNGVAGGELSYIEGNAHVMSYADLALKNELVRYFNNNSGGNVSINEVGLILSASANGDAKKWLQARDKLASTVTVPDTGQLKVTYTISLTYPS